MLPRYILTPHIWGLLSVRPARHVVAHLNGRNDFFELPVGTWILMKNILAAVASTLLSSILFFSLMEPIGNLIPCEWFGTAREGACGYGAVWLTLAVVVLLTVAGAVGLFVAYKRVRSK